MCHLLDILSFIQPRTTATRTLKRKSSSESNRRSFPAFCGNQNLIIAFTGVHNGFLSYPTLIHSTIARCNVHYFPFTHRSTSHPPPRGQHTRDVQTFQTSRSHLKNLGARRVTKSKVHTEHPQISGATVKNLAARTTWSREFVHPCSTHEFETPTISKQSAHEGGKDVSPRHRPPLSPRRYSSYISLLEAESTPGSWCGRKD
jgi:hypothetical protein